MSHYSEQYESLNDEIQPLCHVCEDKKKPSLTRLPGKEWLCDDCAADLEFLDKTLNKCQERKNKRIADAKEV